MSFKKSANESKNTDWGKNLTRFDKSLKMRRKINNFEKDLSTLSRLPKKSIIIGRMNYLSKNEKSRLERIDIIANELNLLWHKMSIPCITLSSIKRKIGVLNEKNEKDRKRPKETFSELFDVTDTKGDWLSREDKEFYKKQIESCGEIGYSSIKAGKIHPSKIKSTCSKEIGKTFFYSKF